jgi:hypothetical protein
MLSGSEVVIRHAWRILEGPSPLCRISQVWRHQESASCQTRFLFDEQRKLVHRNILNTM